MLIHTPEILTHRSLKSQTMWHRAKSNFLGRNNSVPANNVLCVSKIITLCYLFPGRFYMSNWKWFVKWKSLLLMCIENSSYLEKAKKKKKIRNFLSAHSFLKSCQQSSQMAIDAHMIEQAAASHTLAMSCTWNILFFPLFLWLENNFFLWNFQDMASKKLCYHDIIVKVWPLYKLSNDTTPPPRGRRTKKLKKSE